jgi:hypothetical protein
MAVNLLLSAAAYDLFGPSEKCPFDCDYLQEILGCLITVDDMGYVTLAHYTVLEFLTSPHILQTRVAFFTLSIETIDIEFETSVLRQALAANPAGQSTSWESDREAYCLTLGAALGRLGDVDVNRLLIQYFNPANPHYVRFRAIQERIHSNDDGSSDGFYLGYLPAALCTPSAPGGHDPAAEVLLNIILIPERISDLGFLPYVEHLAGGRSLDELLGVTVSGFFVGGKSYDVHAFKGTVREITSYPNT